MNYLEQGTLYGMQPYCEQGPVIYGVGFFLKALFGLAQVELLARILFIIISFLTFLLLFTLVKKETGEEWTFSVFILYLAFLFYPMQGILEMALAVFFLLCGYYCLFHTQSKRKELYAGLFFSLSLLSKMSGVYLVLTLLLIYVFKMYKQEQGLGNIFKNR